MIVRAVQPAAVAASLRLPEAANLGEVIAFEHRAGAALAGTDCAVVVRVMPDAQLPAIHLNRGALDSRSPGLGKLEHLVLNWDNRVVRGLVRTSEETVFSRVLQVLYVQAKMAAGQESREDRTMLSAALDDVLALAIGAEGTLP